MNTRGMTPMAHHAMCLAAGGYWQLADAMELIHHSSEDERVLAIHHAPSHLTMLGLADAIETGDCEVCCGTGTVECDMGHMHTCQECDGEGDDGEIKLRDLQWVSLDGSSDEAFQPSHQFTTTLQPAKALVREYTRLIERLQVAA